MRGHASPAALPVDLLHFEVAGKSNSCFPIVVFGSKCQQRHLCRKLRYLKGGIIVGSISANTYAESCNMCARNGICAGSKCPQQHLRRRARFWH